jgi:hypothetical protein
MADALRAQSLMKGVACGLEAPAVDFVAPRHGGVGSAGFAAVQALANS